MTITAGAAQAAFSAVSAMMRVTGSAALLPRIQELPLESKRQQRLILLASESS